MSIIAVTGASGNLGQATVEFLVKRGVRPEDVVLVVRDAAKVQHLAARGLKVRQGDYTDAASLQKCFEGIDKLLFISTSALGEERMRHHRNVVTAARAAAVGHILYTSVIKPAASAAFPPTPGHFQTEALIRESKLPYSFFRNNLYMELVPLLFSGAAESGILMSCAGTGRIGFVTRLDIAEGLAVALTSSKSLRSTYDITCSRSPYTLAEVAAFLGDTSGRSVKYVNVTAEEFRRTLTGHGLPAEVVAFSVALGEAMRAGEFDASSLDLQTLLQRKPTELATFQPPVGAS